MNRIFRGVASLLVLSTFLLCAQGGGSAARSAAARSSGTICKDEVDRLIGVVRDTARKSTGAVLGGDSVVATAKILTAMGHCHRRYYKGDGPVVRPSLDFLIRARKADGSFGDVVATAWTIEALRVMDEDSYRDEVQQARKWLARLDGPTVSFQQSVSAVLEQVRADVWPQTLAADALAECANLIAAPATLDRDKAADVLLQLVACQAANRLLDKASQPVGQSPGQEPGDAGKNAAGKKATAEAPPAEFTAAQQKAFAWLYAQQKEGVFSATFGGKTFPDPALTGFGLLAMQTKPQGKRTAEEQAVIEAGLRWLLKNQNEDGTFGQQVPNYTTCVVAAALVRWDDPAVKPALEKAQKAILAFQNIEASGYQSGDRDYGSIGYGSSQRGDLSNLHFSLETLKATGLPENHEAFAKAIVFLQRTQNLKSVNDFSGKVPDPDHEGKTIDATSGDDGGASYYPGNSNAGYLVQPDGKSVPRSYGSMTYALLKAYTLAGVKSDDKRVQAAVKWIQSNWDLATNPGADPALGEKTKYAGLFYYYMVLAQALDVAKVATVEVAAGNNDKGEPVTKPIDWKKALRAQLEGMQQKDGTWLNGKNDRWMEGMPLLCTCYAMVALELCN